MSDTAMMRTDYWNRATGTVRGGPTGHGESLTDMERYLLPLDRARSAGLTTWGVAGGLTVRAATGQAGVTVTPGVALDAAGAPAVLSVNGAAIVDQNVDPHELQNIPTVTVPAGGLALPTAGMQGDRLLTVTAREVVDTGVLASAPVLLHAPWLRLVPATGFQDNGAQVVLARVTLDAEGKVTGLSAGPRRLVGAVAERLELRVPRVRPGTAPEVEQAPAAELRARADGGLDVNVHTGGTFRPALTVEGASGDVTVSRLQVRGPGGAPAYRMSSGAGGTWHVADATKGDRLVIDAAGNVGIGVGADTLQRTVHVEGLEVHSGGTGGGYSFADRNVKDFVNVPGAGERWVWYAAAGAAHLWSNGNRLSVTASGEGGGLDVARRMRVRQGGDASAGIWLHQTVPNQDRAFVGMAGDSLVGFWGNTGIGWGLTMDTGNGQVRTTGSVAIAANAVVGAGGNGVLTTRHIDGKHFASDNPDGLFLNWSNGQAVHVGGGARADLFVNGALTATHSAVAITGKGGNGAFQAGVRGQGNIGVWAEGSNNGILAAGTNNAGSFLGRVFISGDLDVRGTVFKGGGGFRIDHPLDPAGKYLSHSFVESPEMLTVYAGRAVTDEQGEATVELPDYYEALNRDHGFQVTPIGQLAVAAADGEVRDNRFTIRTDKPGVTVSWLVTGVRRDPWAEEHRIEVEHDKPAEERDHYLHPATYGQAEETSLLAPGVQRW